MSCLQEWIQFVQQLYVDAQPQIASTTLYVTGKLEEGLQYCKANGSWIDNLLKSTVDWSVSGLSHAVTGFHSSDLVSVEQKRQLMSVIQTLEQAREQGITQVDQNAPWVSGNAVRLGCARDPSVCRMELVAAAIACTTGMDVRGSTAPTGCRFRHACVAGNHAVVWRNEPTAVAHQTTVSVADGIRVLQVATADRTTAGTAAITISFF